MEKVNFLESKTLQNLARSFASECMEGAKYQFLSQMCVQEKYNFLESTLKTLAKHEMSHAKVFWDIIVLSSPDKVIENIDFSMGYPFQQSEFEKNFEFDSENEKELSTQIYPNFAKIAKDEGFKDIGHTFELVATVENCHSMLLEQIVDKLKNNKVYKNSTQIKWKCSECGFEHTSKDAFKVCPLCKKEQGYVEIPFKMQ